MSENRGSATDSNNNSASTDASSQHQSQNRVSSFVSALNIDKSVGVVGVSEGISYGLGLMVYFILLTVITGLVAGFGFVFFIGSGAVDNIVVTAVLGLIAVVVYMAAVAVFFAGFAGLLYKIITDAVARALKALS